MAFGVIEPTSDQDILAFMGRRNVNNQPVNQNVNQPSIIPTGFQQPVPLRAGGLPGENFFTGQQPIPANQPVTINQPVNTAIPQPQIAQPVATVITQPQVAPPVVQTPEQIAQQAEINAVPSGLIGAESALQTGATGSQEALVASLGASRTDIEVGGVSALQRLEGARGEVATGTQQSIQDILAGTTGVSTLEQGRTEGLQFLETAFNQAVDPLTGFIDPGKQAQILQAALTGALGPEAQRAALADFQNDPGIQFATEEAERSLLRNTAAIGGLGGGNVRKELQRQAIGRAQQSFNDRIAQLGQVASTGLTAAQTAGGIEAQRGFTGVDLIGRTAGAAADIESVITRLTQEGAFAQADISGSQALLERAIGQDLSLLEQATGINVAQTIQNLGSASAELRSQAGRDLADAIASTTESLAAQQATEGAGISDIVSTNITNIANTLLREGLLNSGSDEQLAILLGNLSVGQGTTAAQIAANVGLIEASGILGTNKIVTDSIASLIDLLKPKPKKTP